MYNFHKVRGDRNEFEFEHEKFRKDRPDLLSEIRRKPTDSSLNNIPSVQALQLEGERSPIKMENQEIIEQKGVEEKNMPIKK